MRSIALCLFLLFAGFSFAWWDGSFAYRTQFNISNPGSALTDYQVQVAPSIYNNTGLVGSWHFSEGNGIRAYDSSGIGNDGTLNGFGWTSISNWTQGKFGSGIQFDGLDDNVDAGNAASLNSAFDGSYTVEMWVKTASAEALKGLFEKRDTGTATMMAFFNFPSAGKVNFYSGSNVEGDALDSAASNLNNGLWRHLVFQLDGTTQRIYVDGALDSSRTKVGGTSADGTFRIGRLSTTYFNGAIDEVRVYNRSLSAQEISELYNASKARLDYADLRFTQPYTIYETLISLSGAGSDLTDYQVLINITNQTILSHMRPDGADLRFFQSATSTPYSSSGLSYWIENISSTQAKVWVKANVSAGGSTLYMYYGNSSSSAQSNGSAVFLFFDDFEDGNFADGPVWTKYGSASWSASSKYMSGSGGGTYYVGTPFSQQYNLSWNVRARHTGVATDYLWRFLHNGADVTGNGVAGQANGGMYFYCGGTNFAGSLAFDTNWHSYRITRGADGWKSYVDGALMGSSADTGGCTATHFVMQDNSNAFDFDDVFIRKYSAAEPSATIGSETVKSPGNEAALPHWLESDKRAWVKVPSVPAGNSLIYMYYGNASAASASNGTAAFVFFDDFSGNLGKWTNNYPARIGIVSGELRQTQALGTGSQLNDIYTISRFSPQTSALDYKVRIEGTQTDAWYIGWRGDGTANNRYYVVFNPYVASAEIGIGATVGSVSTAGVSAGTSHNIGAYYNFRAYINGNTFYVNTELASLSETDAKYAQITSANVGLSDWADTLSAYYDDIRIRKYASPEPSASSGVEQQPDITAPSVSISSPTSVIYSSVFVPLNFTASDSSGISFCKYELNGVNTTLSGCLNTTMTAQSGSNSLTVWASDGSNWGSASVSFNVSLDTTPPSISISSPANVSYPSASVPVIFIASDASGVSSCVVRLNASINSSSCNNYTLALGNGIYTLNISANDSFGNLNSSAVSFAVSLTVSVSNSTTTNSIGIGNVSLNGIPPAASLIVYSVGSQSFSKSFSASSGVSSVRISARATLQGTPASSRSMAFAVS